VGSNAIVFFSLQHTRMSTNKTKTQGNDQVIVTRREGNTYFVTRKGREWRVEVFDVPEEPDQSLVMSITARLFLKTPDGTFKEMARTGPGWWDDKAIILILDEDDEDEDDEDKDDNDNENEIDDSECVVTLVDELMESCTDELEEVLAYGGVRYPSWYGSDWNKPLAVLPPPHNK
jgi:hypothetical protein